MVCTGNCTLPNFCDSRQGEKKVTVGAVSGGSVGLPETRTFFFWPNYHLVFNDSVAQNMHGLGSVKELCGG